MRSLTSLNFENIDNNCFCWSILANIYPCENSPPNIISNYTQNFYELNFQCFNFSNGFKCNDVYKFEKIKTFSSKIYDLGFCEDKKWKQELMPIAVSKNDSDRVVDLLIHKNHYVLISRKVNISSGNHDCKLSSRKCLSSSTSQIVLMNHKQRCEQKELTGIRTSSESHFFWEKKTFS